MIFFAIDLFPAASFLADILFMVRIFFDVTQFCALVATIEASIAWLWANGFFRGFATKYLNSMAATRKNNVFRKLAFDCQGIFVTSCLRCVSTI